jgi:hypothetical protein
MATFKDKMRFAILVFGGCLILWNASASAQGTKGAQTPETTVQQQPTRQTAEPVEACPPVPTRDEQAEACKRQYETEDTARQKADLAAQQGMAKAAQEQLALIRDQNRQIFWSNLLLGLTLAATAWAAIAASKAARAADEATSVSRRIGEAQTRAYVNHAGVVLKPLTANEPLHITVNFKNSGLSPALDLQIFADGDFLPIDTKDNDFPAVDRGKSNVKATLGAGSTANTVIITDAVPSPDVLGKFVSGEIAAFAWGRIWYKDVFGQERETAFRVRNTNMPFNRPSDMLNCASGNWAT